MGVVAYPRLASVEHVQQHAAAAPHIRLGAELISSGHLGGHVGLRAREGSSYIHRQTVNSFSFICFLSELDRQLVSKYRSYFLYSVAVFHCNLPKQCCEKDPKVKLE